MDDTLQSAQPLEPTQDMNPPIEEPSFSSGGFLSNLDGHKLAVYVMIGFFIAGSAFQIAYYRKALEENND